MSDSEHAAMEAALEAHGKKALIDHARFASSLDFEAGWRARASLPPTEAMVEAAAKELFRWATRDAAIWDIAPDAAKDVHRMEARAALTAALSVESGDDDG